MPPSAYLTSYIIVDTPGQMEVFLWSASGQILLDTLASSYPTVLAYIIDTPRSSSPATFMSNMLYACSVLYKTSLPMVLVCNKTDVKGAGFVREWMTDFEAFQGAVRGERGSAGEEGMGYMGSLMGSMGLVLEEFYHQLDAFHLLTRLT
jgi:GPN-loop GTPase